MPETTTIAEYTTKEAAKHLGLKSDSTLRHAIRDGKLAATKHGRDWFIGEEALEAWAKEHQPKPRKPYTKRSQEQ